MARKPRILSESGMYHIVSRGIDKMSLFVEDEDCIYFLKCLRLISEDEGVEVHCYCLMDNHFHLLVKTKDQESPATFMQRLKIKYTLYFNRKYERLGPLYQERYKSECIEDDQYYMTVFRYILRNPVKAGVVRDPFEYKWSSAEELAADCAYITKISDECLYVTKKELVDFIKESSDEKCVDVSDNVRYASDRTAKRVFASKHAGNVLLDVRFFEDNAKKEVFNLLYSVNCSIRQISRLTGIPRGIIKRLSAA